MSDSEQTESSVEEVSSGKVIVNRPDKEHIDEFILSTTKPIQDVEQDEE